MTARRFCSLVISLLPCLVWCHGTLAQLPGSSTPPPYQISGYNRLVVGPSLEPSKKEAVIYNSNHLRIANRASTQRLDLAFYEFFLSEDPRALADLSSACYTIEPRVREVTLQAGRFGISGLMRRETIDGAAVAYAGKRLSASLSGGIVRHLDYNNQFVNGVPVGRLLVAATPHESIEFDFAAELSSRGDTVFLAEEPLLRWTPFKSGVLAFYAGSRFFLNREMLERLLAGTEVVPVRRLSLTFEYEFDRRLDKERGAANDIFFDFAAGSLERFHFASALLINAYWNVVFSQDITRYVLQTATPQEKELAYQGSIATPIQVSKSRSVTIGPRLDITRSPRGDLFGGGLEFSARLGRWDLSQGGRLLRCERSQKADRLLFLAHAAAEVRVRGPFFLSVITEVFNTTEADLVGRGFVLLTIRDWALGI